MSFNISCFSILLYLIYIQKNYTASMPYCNCKKITKNISLCCSLYCTCRKNGSTCSPSCDCSVECGNEYLLDVKEKKIRCNCKSMKSKCLKKYCECFEYGQYCTNDCTCKEICHNRKYIKDTKVIYIFGKNYMMSNLKH
jgi:hypothetical protein